MQVNFNQSPNYSFRGHLAKSEDGNTYYKTNTATKVGVTLGILELAGSLAFKPLLEFEEKVIKNHAIQPAKAETDFYNNAFKVFKEFKNIPAKNFILLGAIGFGLNALCGYFTDYFRNKKAAEATDDVKRLGLKNAIKENENIELTDNRKPYYNSNLGAKLGIGLGAIYATISHYARSGLYKNAEAFKPKAFALIPNIISCAIGGAILGAITDSVSNKAGKKHA